MEKNCKVIAGPQNKGKPRQWKDRGEMYLVAMAFVASTFLETVLCFYLLQQSRAGVL